MDGALVRPGSGAQENLHAFFAVRQMRPGPDIRLPPPSGNVFRSGRCAVRQWGQTAFGLADRFRTEGPSCFVLADAAAEFQFLRRQRVQGVQQADLKCSGTAGVQSGCFSGDAEQGQSRDGR